uniref:SSD domain-containing protein n=1 Tax=Elaeophora elaphi TaxID=1147741 RepID=A0A0R3RUZ4_9BILA
MIENSVPLSNPAMVRLCQIPARQTGIASLCMQLVGLVMSAALTLHLILHLSGITVSKSIKQQSKRPEATDIVTLINIRTTNATEEVSKDIMNWTEKIIWDENLTSDANVNGTFDEIGLQLDLTELIQISTGVYTGMCILWLLSLMSLLASIKLESLDLIIINSVLLTIAMIYAITHALFVSILFIYHVSLNSFISKQNHIFFPQLFTLWQPGRCYITTYKSNRMLY